MYISKVSLRNYRNFSNSKFEFKKGINTIIGENGSGKTNLFRAIRLLLDDNLLRFSYRLNENDFNRKLADNWKCHWIIISIEFSDLSPDEAIQSLFVHGVGDLADDIVDKATYNLFFRPKADIRFRLSELEEDDFDGFQEILDSLTINNYETVFTGKSTVDFNDDDIYQELVGNFDTLDFNLEIDESRFGVKIPHQLSISNEISFTFIKALRDVVSDFNSNMTNPLLTLLKSKSEEIGPEDFEPIAENIRLLNEQIENLEDIREISKDIKDTINEAVGETYAPSSLSIKSNMSDEANKLLQSLKLYIGEPGETYEGAIHELSLGGANLIFLTLKLLEYKYQKEHDTFANFLLIEEPEAHIHTHIQKTLFENLDYSDTQIIYSTHSTHISEVSKISNMNILAKKENFAEVYQPSKGLDEQKTIKLERYLDAVRSNLLFAKGVLLVEGDAEAILIPNFIKKLLGISLDELGISLINIGSTGFENVAQIFHQDRIRRKCSIITDLDQAIADTTIQNTDTDTAKAYKTKMQNSHVKGQERQLRLDSFSRNNEWLNVYYATHTFEVDFVLNNNISEAKELCDEIYTDPTTIRNAKDDIESGNVALFGKRILTMANNQGKGWFAILLSEKISFKTRLPQYIVDALIFLNSIHSDNIKVNIIKYRIKQYMQEGSPLDFRGVNEMLANNDIPLADIISYLVFIAPEDQIFAMLAA